MWDIKYIFFNMPLLENKCHDLKYDRMIKSLRLEKTSKIMKSNLQPNTNNGKVILA